MKRLQLPNGSTDVKALATDSKGNYAYAVHLLARYQLPTNQVDRGWMSTNVLSVINLHTQEVENTVLLDTPQKGASNPWNVIVSPDDSKIWISVSGSHELVCVDRIALHDRLARAKEGEKVTPSTKDYAHIPDDAGFLYGIRDFYKTQGKGPRALYVTPDKVYTANYYTGELVAFNGNGKIWFLPHWVRHSHPLKRERRYVFPRCFHRLPRMAELCQLPPQRCPHGRTELGFAERRHGES